MDDFTLFTSDAYRWRHPRTLRVIGTGIALLSLMSFMACGTPGYVHLYSKAQDDLAQSIKDNYGKAKIPEALKAEMAKAARVVKAAGITASN